MRRLSGNFLPRLFSSLSLALTAFNSVVLCFLFGIPGEVGGLREKVTARRLVAGSVWVLAWLCSPLRLPPGGRCSGKATSVGVVPSSTVLVFLVWVVGRHRQNRLPIPVLIC